MTLAMAQNTNQSILSTKFKNFDIITANTQLVYDDVIHKSTRTNAYTLYVNDDITGRWILHHPISSQMIIVIHPKTKMVCRLKKTKPSCLAHARIYIRKYLFRVFWSWLHLRIYLQQDVLHIISNPELLHKIYPPKTKFMYSPAIIIDDSSIKCGMSCKKKVRMPIDKPIDKM